MADVSEDEPECDRCECTPLLGSHSKPVPEARCFGFPKHSFLTILLLCVAYLLDSADGAVKSGMMRALEKDFKLDPDQMGLMIMSGSLAAAFTSPFWGFLADNFNRIKLIAIGVSCWTCTTVLSAVAPNFTILCVMTALTGLAASSMLPITQGLVADMVSPNMRGRVYGLTGLCSGTGSALSLFIATTTAESSFHGIFGWRIQYLVIAAASGVYVAVLLCFGSEPKRKSERGNFSVATYCSYIKHALSIPSIWLIMVQGCFGAIPFSALASFSTLWMQYVGVNNGTAGACSSLFRIATGLAALLGGFIGDWAATVSPDYGRPRVAQVALTYGMTMALVIYVLIPDEPSYGTTYMVCFFIFGLHAWCLHGVNMPIIAEVVPSHMRASVMAVEWGIECTSAAILGGPIVGVLAKHVFGYEGTEGEISEMSEERRQQTANALRNALATMTLLPWAICLCFYCALGYYYPADRDRALTLELEANKKRRNKKAADDEDDEETKGEK